MRVRWHGGGGGGSPLVDWGVGVRLCARGKWSWGFVDRWRGRVPQTREEMKDFRSWRRERKKRDGGRVE
jgi:hypothetical protein